MSNARAQFLRRLARFHASVQEPLLQNLPPHEADHNDRAKLLRNGLAVVGFATLEGFLKERSKELLAKINQNTMPFSDLPKRIRNASTVDVLSAASENVKRIKGRGEDPIAFVQSIASVISGTTSATYELSEYLFGRSRSNINSDELRQMLSNFGVKDPWSDMNAVARRCGIGIPSLEGQYKQIYHARNAAAHDSDCDTTVVLLTNYSQTAMALAVSFDILLSQALFLINSRDESMLRDEKFVYPERIKLSFLKEHRKQWRDIPENSVRARRIYPDFDAAFKDTTRLAGTRGQHVIVHNSAGLPLNWVTVA